LIGFSRSRFDEDFIPSILIHDAHFAEFVKRHAVEQFRFSEVFTDVGLTKSGRVNVIRRAGPRAWPGRGGAGCFARPCEESRSAA
jgi:hypothetical protein